MTIQSAEDLNSKLTELEEVLPSFDGVNNSLWNTSSLCKILLTESEATSKPVKITRAAKRFTPDRPFYLDSIDFYSEDPLKLPNNLTVTVKPLGKPAISLHLESTPQSRNLKFCYLYFKNFCEWFEIYSDSTFYKPLIKKINIFGAGLNEISEHADTISSITKLKKEIASYQEQIKTEYKETAEQIDSLSSRAEELENTISENTERIESLNLEKNLLESDVAQLEQDSLILKNKVAFAEDRLNQAENNFAQLKSNASELNKEISILNNQLKALTSDKNLISDEFGPYVKEGKSQAITYVLIVILPLLAIIFSVYELYLGASSLLTAENRTTTEIIGSFILRIPFASVFGLAIYYSWKLTSAIIQKVFTIHSDRLTLAKLLVLARESVHSSAKNLDLSNETIFQEQLRFKVDVLRSHLSKDLGKDFRHDQLQEDRTKHQHTPKDAANDTDAENSSSQKQE
ncbi:hypothetical protein [Pseudomonas protegens]|uniref:hypothetical protein n=1 Tax=Pseudomonas protegens TaxID=380021 RepID=UPI00320B6268